MNQEIQTEQNEKQKPVLFTFAFCGLTEVYNSKLKQLANMAEYEPWTYNDPVYTGQNIEYNVLFHYINNVFEMAYKQNKILYNNNNTACCFNTGLLTTNGQEILGLFSKNIAEAYQDWYLVGYYPQDSWEYLQKFNEIPTLATFTEDYEELFFNPKLNITLNIDHILNDNYDRLIRVLPSSYSGDVDLLKTILNGAVVEMKKKLKRNYRLAIPQYYNSQIMQLVPLEFPSSRKNRKITLALALQRLPNNQYRANTILTLEMAYIKARCIAPQIDNWLSKQLNLT